MSRGPSGRSGREAGATDIEVCEQPGQCGRLVGRMQHYKGPDGLRTWKCCEGPHERWEVVRGRGA